MRIEHVIVVLMFAACGAAQKKRSSDLQDRAAFDLSCPANQLKMTKLGNEDQMGVEGCGKRASYVFVKDAPSFKGDYSSNGSWVKDGQDNSSSAATSDAGSKR